MRINTNLTALNTYSQYTNNTNKISDSVAKLSSGYAINSAADNAAGLAISEKMRAQIRGLDQASANSQDAVSLVQTAEGALGSSTEILQRMREIAVQSSSDTNNDSIDREALQDEFSQLQSELDDISSTTSFNKKSLLDGSIASSTSSVNVTKLANTNTAVSVGNAAAGNYAFTVSVQQETSAVEAKDATGTASLGSTASKTISKATVAMGANSGDTALYNGDYTLSATSNSTDGSITVTAKSNGDTAQTFSCTLDKADIDGKSALALTFETTEGAADGFTLNLNLSSAADADSTNSLSTVAGAISDTTVSVSGGVDKVDATYGVYANCTGGTSVKLNAGDTSVTFDNGVTVSFDELSATDVAVDPSKSTVLSPDGIAADFTAGTATTKASVAFDFSALSGLATGSEFAIQVGDKTYSGTYKGDIQGTLTSLLSASTADVTDNTTGAACTMTVSNAGVVTYTSTSDGAHTINISGTNCPDTNDTLVSLSTKAATASPVTSVTAGSATAAASFSTAAVDDSADGDAWYGAVDGDTVYLQVGDTVYEGTYDTDVDTTLTKMMSGTSITADDGTSYSVTGISSGVVTYTATAVGAADFSTVTTRAGTAATGESANLSDGLVSKLGATADTGTDSTTATKFNVTKTDNAGLTFQVGANEGDELTINIDKMDCQTLGVNSSKVDTQDSAAAAITAVDDAINQVSSQRAYLGAIQNRLDYKSSNLDTANENLTAAESQIRDVDMAKEMTTFTNSNILLQASTAMLAQANSLPQNVLSLIG